MKKIILTAAAVFAFSFANAQEAKSMGFAKGDVYASGSISTSKVGDADASTTFAPSVGYFVSNNISLAASLETSNNGDDKSTIIGLGAAYVFNAGNQFSSQIGASVGFGNGSESGVDFNATAFSLSYGINYFVSSNFALTANLAALEYVSVKDDVAGAKAVNTTSIGVDLSNISLGLAYKF
jgi:hypothetical protein